MAATWCDWPFFIQQEHFGSFFVYISKGKKWGRFHEAKEGISDENGK